MRGVFYIGTRNGSDSKPTRLISSFNCVTDQSRRTANRVNPVSVGLRLIPAVELFGSRP
jgi:hypothetical protein